MPLTRRETLAAGLAAAGAGALLPNLTQAMAATEIAFAEGKFVLPPLPYAYDALEPHLDAATMKLHHDLHHKSYVDGLNRALAQFADTRKNSDFALAKHWSREMSFHGAGHLLHTLFWTSMAPKAVPEPFGALAERINSDFGGFAQFKAQFAATAVQVEGSGWAMLGWEPVSGKLVIAQAEKHQNQSVPGLRILLPLDVWEHAYYLKYQNRRAEYVAAWWNVVDWTEIGRRFAANSK